MYKLTHTTNIIRLSDHAFIPADEVNSDYLRYLQWLEEGNTPEPADVVQQNITESYKQAVQLKLDSVAQSFGYDDIKSAVTYAEEPSVPKFQTEGKAFRAWRSLCWSYCYDQLALVQSNSRSVPTVEELVAELPKFVIPE